MVIRSDTILASFVVGIFASFLTALAVLLVKTLSISAFDAKLFANFSVNILILFFLSIFIFFKGSTLAAWLLYRHDVPWGYELDRKKVVPIFILSFLFSVVIYFAIYFYTTAEISSAVYLQKSIQTIKDTAPL